MRLGGRSDKSMSMYGFNVGETVYWTLKDSSYGQRGKVIASSNGPMIGPSLLVMFSGQPWHVEVQFLSKVDPKFHRKERKDQKLVERYLIKNSISQGASANNDVTAKDAHPHTKRTALAGFTVQ